MTELFVNNVGLTSQIKNLSKRFMLTRHVTTSPHKEEFEETDGEH